eukprot:m.198747 g.198747  ORF g.198747 m.198747 type:complete len:205 (+) comp17677_c0_seq6:4386-5000(+)
MEEAAFLYVMVVSDDYKGPPNTTTTGTGTGTANNNTNATSLALQYNIFYSQDILHIDMYVFFAVFFSCFFLIVAGIFGFVYVRNGMVVRNVELNTASRYELQATRPIASVLMLWPPKPLRGQQAKAYIAAVNRGDLPANPITEQPVRGSRVAVSTYLVEMPYTGHRRFMFGTALVKRKGVLRLASEEFSSGGGGGGGEIGTTAV